jgi:hypothetical protein
LDLPHDFTRLVSNLYSGKSTESIIPHGHIPPVGIKRGTVQHSPLSPILFDLMIKPLIRWFKAYQKGYNIAFCGLQLASKNYHGDGILVINSVKDIIALFNLVDQFSIWSGIHLNIKI